MAKLTRFRNIPFYIFCTFIMSLVFLAVSVIPFGNSKYNNQLYLATRDKGWDSIKLIKPDDLESIIKAKEEFDKNIKSLHNLRPPVVLLGYLFRDKELNGEVSKAKYIEIYTDFYNGSFFNDWQEITTKHIERNKLYDDFQKKDKEKASYIYVSETTKRLTNELYDISAKMVELDKEIASLQSKADNEYRDFSDRIAAFMERGIDIKSQ